MTARFARLHLEPLGGVAGDMLLAALVDLGADRQPIDAAIASLARPGLALTVERVNCDGLAACAVRSIPSRHEHAHRHLDEILALLARGEMTPPARALATRIFELLAAAEAACHGGTAGEVALHEVGQLDSVLDVVGVSVAIDALGNPTVSSSPLPSGRGQVRTAHGLLGCPVPAVRELARRSGLPLVDVDVQGETITPTGAAVVAAVARHFGPVPSEPPVRVGVGAGTRRFPGRPNVVRALGYEGAA